MRGTFYSIPKLPKIAVFVADKDNKIVFRNDSARVRYPDAAENLYITSFIDKPDIDRYNSLISGCFALERKGVFRMSIGAKKETAIFEQHIADDVILRAFVLLSGEYLLLKEIYDSLAFETFTTERTMLSLHRLAEGIPNKTDSADSIAGLYSQIYNAKQLICSCFGFSQMKSSTQKLPYRFIGFVDFWLNHMIAKMRRIDCDISAQFHDSVSSADYASFNPCGLLIMMTALSAFLAEVSESRKILLRADKRLRVYHIDMSSDVNISVIAQHSSKISSLAKLAPIGCINLLLASSIAKQCGFNLSYSMINQKLVFHFLLNENDIGTLGLKANAPTDTESLYLNIANILFLAE